jgi:adenosylcobinamide-GDP ribazoletransferase
MGEEVAVAVGFLTVLPTPTVAYQPGLLGRGGYWFPVIGLVLGLLLSGGHWLFAHFFSPFLAAALTTALWVLLTGGLHLDGLADCCDGLLAPVPPQRRLEIMRDPRAGAFAVIGVSVFLLLKVSALAALSQTLPALLIAPTWARWLLLWIGRRPLARTSGLGVEFSSQLVTRTLLIALIVPLTLAAIFLTWRLGLGLLCAFGVVWLIARSARQRLGGLTGDVYGLAVELAELAVLLVFAAR